MYDGVTCEIVEATRIPVTAVARPGSKHEGGEVLWNWRCWAGGDESKATE